MRKLATSIGLFILPVLFWLIVGQTAVSSHIHNQAGTHALYLPLIQSPVSNAPNLNLNVRAATYLGGSADDLAHGLDIAPARSVVIVGAMPGHNPGGVTPIDE